MLCLASDAAGLLVFAPPGPRIAMDAIGFRHRPCVARRVPATEVRGPLGPRLRWSLWMVGRWPHLKPRFLEVAALWYPPFAGVPAGSGPPPEGHMPQPTPVRQGDPVGTPALRTGFEGLSGGNWMVACGSPGTPGLSRRPGALGRPFLISQLSPPSAGGLGPPGGLALRQPLGRAR